MLLIKKLARTGRIQPNPSFQLDPSLQTEEEDLRPTSSEAEHKDVFKNVAGKVSSAQPVLFRKRDFSSAHIPSDRAKRSWTSQVQKQTR